MGTLIRDLLWFFQPVPQQRLDQGTELAALLEQPGLHFVPHVLMNVHAHLLVRRVAVLGSWSADCLLRRDSGFLYSLDWCFRHRSKVIRKPPFCVPGM